MDVHLENQKFQNFIKNQNSQKFWLVITNGFVATTKLKCTWISNDNK